MATIVTSREAAADMDGDRPPRGSAPEFGADRQTERSLRESDARFQTILDSAAIGISVNTFEGRPILCNPALQEMLGYSQAELRGMVFTEFTYPDDREPEKRLYQDLLSGRRDRYQLEKRYIRKDGHIIWGRLTVSLLRQPEQPPTHFVAMVEDITDRKGVEQALLQSEERWRSLAGNAPDVILTLDPAGSIRYANRRFEGIPADQLVGRKVYDCVLLEHRDQLRDVIEQAVQLGRPAKYDFSGIGLQGRLAWYSANIAPIGAQERVAGATVVISDISERKQMEDELRDYTHRLETFREIDQAILAAQSPVNIVQGALEHIRELVPCDWVGVSIVEDDRDEFNTLVIDQGDTSRLVTEAGAILAALDYSRLSGGEHLAVGDLAQLAHPNLLEDLLRQAGLSSYALLPLSMHGQLLGILGLASKFPQALQPVHLAIAAEVADLLAVAIQQSRLLSQGQRRATELESLAQISAALRRAETYPELLAKLVGETQAALRADACGLFLRAADKFVLAAGQNPGAPCMDGGRPEGPSCFWQAVHSGHPLYQAAPDPNGPAAQPPCLASAPGRCLTAFVPLRSANTTTGLLVLTAPQPESFAKGKDRLLEAMADIASSALQRAQTLRTLEQQVSDRTRKLNVLYQATAATSETDDLPAMVLGSLEAILTTLPESAGSVQLLDEGRCGPLLVVERGLPDETAAGARWSLDAGTPWEQVIREGLPLRLTGGSAQRRLPKSIQQRGFQVYLGVPIQAGEQTAGVLSVLLLSEAHTALIDLEVLSAVAGQLGRAVERFQLRKKAERTMVVEERQRLARDLHDSITQLLCSQALLAETSRKFVEAGDQTEALPYLKQLVETAHQALKEMRLMIYDLRPSALEKEGLVGALHDRLEAVEQRAGIQVRLAGALARPLSLQQEESLYHVAQELLNNILKHAKAKSVMVYLRDTAGGVELEVVDDGQGFDPAAVSAGMGLRGIRERVESLGGAFSISSQPGRGCRARVSLCLAAEGRPS
jgi:PAS domain S-box-containing protein